MVTWDYIKVWQLCYTVLYRGCVLVRWMKFPCCGKKKLCQTALRYLCQSHQHFHSASSVLSLSQWLRGVLFIYLFLTQLLLTALLQSTCDICCTTELDMAALPASSPCARSRKLQIKLLQQVQLALYSRAHMLTINLLPYIGYLLDNIKQLLMPFPPWLTGFP